MTRTNHFLIRFLFIFLLTSSIVCGQTDTSDISPDKYEPNDIFAQATELAFNTHVKLNFHQKNDVDIIRFTVMQRGLIKWEITNWTGKGNRPYLYYCDSNGKPLPTSDVENLYVTEPGDFGLVLTSVQYSWEKVAVKEPFDFVLRFRPIDDATEPNNTIQTATPVAIGKPVVLRFLTLDDPDFLKIDVPASGVVALNIDGWIQKGRDVYPYLEWFDAEGKKVRQDSYDHRVQQGVYYLKLISSKYSWTQKTHDQPFTATVNFNPQQDPTEPNDTIATARPIKINDTLTMRLRPYGDMDMLRIEVPGRGLVECTAANWDTTVAMQAKPDITFLDEHGKTLIQGKLKALLDKGVYYIQVKSAYYAWEVRSIHKPFDLTVSWTPDGDALEPNNDFATATPAQFDTDYRINIVPEYDVDTFKFQVNSPTNIMMTFKDYKVPQGRTPYPSVQFYDARQKPLIKDDKGTVRVPVGVNYAVVTAQLYSWERTYMTDYFTVRFEKDVTAGKMIENAPVVKTDDPSTIGKVQPDTSISTDTPKPRKRNVKRGVWIFEVEKVQ